MSLINDALKRARQAPAVPAPNLQFRPADLPPVRPSRNLLWPAVLCGGGVLVLGLLWEVSRHNIGPANAQGPVTTVESSVALRESHPAPDPLSNRVKTEFVPVASNSVQAEARPAATNAAQPSGASILNPTPLAPQATVAVVSNPAPPAAPPPPSLRLQGIVFDPRRPSAVISGRTLFVGDRIREFRVTAITADSVTLVGGGQTKVMSLSD